MKVLQLMGMDSTKYGGLEKFNVALQKHAREKGDNIIFVYETKPKSQEFINDIEQNGGKLLILNSKKRIKFLLRLYKIIKEEEIDILHAHFLPARFLAIPFAYYFTNTKLIQTIHSSIKKISLKGRIFYKYLLLNHCFTITVSEDIKKDCIEIFGNKYRIKTSYLGVNRNRFNRESSRLSLNFDPSDIIITTVGNFNFIKGFDVLVKAVSSLDCEGFLTKSVKFIIIGQPVNEKKELQKLIDQLSLDQYFELLGIRDDIPFFLKAADIYCQTSRSEGLSLSLIEALSAGLPIIASNVGGTPEIVEDSVNGILVNPDSVNELSSALKLLISSLERRRKMSINSTTRFRKFEIPASVKSLYSIYRDVS